MEKSYFAGLFLFLLLLTACDDDDLKAPIPAFLTINDISVTTTPSQGTSSDKIVDARVFVNDVSLGTFELPTTIPVQQTGKVNLKIRGGILTNGQSTNRDDYPFYTTYEVDTTFVPESELTINPQVSYFNGVVFGDPQWAGEDFESGHSFDRHDNSDTIFVRTTDPNDTFEGAAGLAYLSEDQEFFEARSPLFHSVPRDGTDVYLEFNYKSTHDFVVSIYTNGLAQQEALVFFRKRTDYTKVYIDLGTVFSRYATSINYSIAFGYSKPKGEISRLLIDNVKMVQF